MIGAVDRACWHTTLLTYGVSFPDLRAWVRYLDPLNPWLAHPWSDQVLLVVPLE